MDIKTEKDSNNFENFDNSSFRNTQVAIQIKNESIDKIVSENLVEVKYEFGYNYNDGSIEEAQIQDDFQNEFENEIEKNNKMLECLKSDKQMPSVSSRHDQFIPKGSRVGKKGIIIHAQGREIINNVSSFMMKEAQDGLSIPLKNHRERTLAATGVSVFSFYRIAREAKKNKKLGTKFKSPSRTRQYTKKTDILTPNQIKCVREIIYDFYLVEKRPPKLKCVLRKINERQIWSEAISLATFYRFIKQIGFSFQVIPHEKQKFLCETHKVRLQRIIFLRKLKEYRNQGRNIIYTGWYSETCKSIKKTYSKTRQNLIIIHAGGENGFIENGLHIFRTGLNTADDHRVMYHELFMHWVQKQLLPNLPEKSVVIVENASYNTVPISKHISKASSKDEMLDWLQENNLSADPNLTKPELYDRIRKNKCFFPIKYKLDNLLEQPDGGHSVLRIPPYHPELNPIEIIWDFVKNTTNTAQDTTKLTLPDIEVLIRQTLAGVSQKVWYDICEPVKKLEQQLMQREHLFDSIVDDLRFKMNVHSSTEESEESDSNDSSDDESE